MDYEPWSNAELSLGAELPSLQMYSANSGPDLVLSALEDVSWWLPSRACYLVGGQT